MLGLLGAGLAKVTVKMRKQAIIRSVLAELGIAEGAFDPARFIMD